MQFYPHRTVEEQAGRLPLQLREAYQNSQIDKITITAKLKTVELTGYAEYSYHEEKSYKTQPVRTNDGKINEIEEYETFLTPRLIIKYNMMNIDDYRETMKLLKSSNAFIVRCYDPVGNKRVSNEMYVAPTNMPVIYQQYLNALGIQEFSIELIGTNRSTDFSINYEEADIFEQYSAPIECTWREFVDEIPFLAISGNYINSTISSEASLFNSELELVSPDDYIVDGEEYYVRTW